MLKNHSGFPLKGLLTGAAISILNIAMSNYRQFEAHGSFTPVLNPKKLTPRASKLLLVNALTIATCGFIDYFYINNFSGLEMHHLHFLEWCKAYRVGKCKLEFQG
jgi:hypothetical protein